jgi:hypothetical protein
LHLFVPFEIADDTKPELRMIPEMLAFLFWLILYIMYRTKGPTLSNGIWDALKQTKKQPYSVYTLFQFMPPTLQQCSSSLFAQLTSSPLLHTMRSSIADRKDQVGRYSSIVGLQDRHYLMTDKTSDYHDG